MSRVSIEFTVVGGNCLLTKHVHVKDGRLIKVAAASPVSGAYAAVSLDGTPDEILKQLSEVLKALGPRQALIAGRLPSPVAPDGQLWRLRLKRAADDGVSLPRTQQVFRPSTGPSLGFLDFDIPEAIRKRFPDLRALYALLVRTWPDFACTAMLVRPSVSSGVKVQGHPAPLPTGFHIFFVASDGHRVGQLADAMFDRLALSGEAFIVASKRGSRLRRALVDPSATKGSERLIFEADAVFEVGIVRVPRKIVLFHGSILDVEAAVAAMAAKPGERSKLQRVWQEAEERARPELDAAREKWLQGRTVEIVRQRRVSPIRARQIAVRETASFEAGELRDDFPIVLDDGSVVTPYDIILEPDHFKGARGYSLDENPPRPTVSFIWPYLSKPDPKSGKPAGPWLHTFEHGGRYFRLRSLRADVDRHRRFVNAHSIREI